MKWGVRRTEAQLARAANASEDYKVAKAAASKPASSLSNAEMRALVERINLEKQYAQAISSSTNTTRGQKASKFVKDLLVDVGTNEVRRVAKGAAQIAVENALQSKKVTGKEFGKSVGVRIQPKKK